MTDDALREEIARALDSQGAFCGDCGGEPGEFYDTSRDALVKRVADAILPIIARVEREAYRRGQVKALREAVDELGQQGTEPWNRNSLAIFTLQFRADSIAREAQ